MQTADTSEEYQSAYPHIFIYIYIIFFLYKKELLIADIHIFYI